MALELKEGTKVARIVFVGGTIPETRQGVDWLGHVFKQEGEPWQFEAVELYPSEQRLIDTANQYHLFVLPSGMAWPFGYFYREVSALSSQGSVQRPFAPHVCPPDLSTPQQIAERECRPLTPGTEGVTCDWGGCSEEAVVERFSTKHGWLAVCEACATKGIIEGGNDGKRMDSTQKQDHQQPDRRGDR